jgi:hypothetical protein
MSRNCMPKGEMISELNYNMLEFVVFQFPPSAVAYQAIILLSWQWDVAQVPLASSHITVSTNSQTPNVDLALVDASHEGHHG